MSQAVIPDWAKNQILPACIHLVEVLKFSQLAMIGVVTVRYNPDAVTQALAKRGAERGELWSIDTDAFVEAAQHHLESDFRMLLGHAVVSTWSTLELFAQNFAAQWIENHPRIEEISSAEMQAILSEIRLKHGGTVNGAAVVARIKRKFPANTDGADGLNLLLIHCGLPGTVPSDRSELLTKLRHARRCFAHNNGFVDDRMAVRFQGYVVGNELSVKADELDVMGGAALEFVQDTLARVQAHFAP